MNEDETPSRSKRDGRRRRAVIAVVGVAVVVAALVAIVVILWARSGTRSVSIDEVERPTGTTVPAEVSVLRPAQGVYQYEGSGTDRIDKPSKQQAQGPMLPATVTHRADGCWGFRIDYSTFHWQTWTYCPTADGGLDESGGTSFQKWDFGAFSTDATNMSRCDDAVTIRPNQQPGDSWNQTCVSTSSASDGETTSSGPITFVGFEALEIGGVPVQTLHYRLMRTMTGSPQGTEDSEMWFAADTGLPVRNVRSITASTSTMIGEVTYTEQGEFQLVSSQPSPG